MFTASGKQKFMIKNSLIFNFIKDKHVASVAPTSKKNVLKICKRIDFNKDIVIVEYGPGNGVFTKYLLSKISANSKLIVIERNKGLALELLKNKDQRLKVFNDSAQNINQILEKENIEKVDYVISGIPLSFLNYQEREELVKNTYRALKNKGIFIVYQFTKKSKKLIVKYFNNIYSHIRPLNMPPLFVFEAVKISENEY